MGATCTNPQDAGKLEIPDMENYYRSQRLPEVPSSAYRTDFERDFFMVVNLLRDNPLSFQSHIRNYVSKGKFAGNPEAANTLIRRLKTLDKLEPIMPNDHASNACFVNLTKNEATPQNISSNAVKELKSLEPLQIQSQNKELQWDERADNNFSSYCRLINKQQQLMYQTTLASILMTMKLLILDPSTELS